MRHPIEIWHELVAQRDVEALDALLAEEVVFHSPVVHTPQRGKPITTLYLKAAMQVLNNDSFRYLREVRGQSDAVLEFATELDGIHINGVDIIHWNAEGKIDDFKVMVRPLKAINLLHAQMKQMLEQMGALKGDIVRFGAPRAKLRRAAQADRPSRALRGMRGTDCALPTDTRRVCMSESSEPSGPDLRAGVPADSVREGTPVLGHIDGEAVMLVRSAGALFATAASCTHYGGPLAQGLVADKTVRCPWHHACFDLQTGLARGPALTPLACYDVVPEGRLLRVGNKRAPYAAPQAAGPSSVVIVGAGPAGTACAESLRRLGYAGPITLVGDEAPGPVDRPNLSKDYLAGSAPEEWIPLRDAGFFRAMNVTFRLGDPVRGIDPRRRTVELTNAGALSYGALVLATGAAPRRLPIPGAERARLLRTLADAQALIALAKPAVRAVVIGSSFIGLEVAASLRAREVSVDVVAPESIPLEGVVGTKLGQHVRRLHERHGVTFHLGRTPARIDADSVLLDDGTRLPADVVVLGVGVTPRTALAEQAGLAVERGIVVDEQLRTSADNVYAVGDVASYPDPRSGARVRIEHWAVAERQGQAVARTLLGQAHPYRDVPFFWSAHYDHTLSYVGHAEAWDRTRERGSLESGRYAVAFERGDTILAVVSLGDDRLSLEAEAAMQTGDEAALKALFAG